MYSLYPSSFDPHRGLRLALETSGDRRYLRTEFLDIPSSRAIPRIDRPSPFISYSSFTVLPLSNSLGRLRVAIPPNAKVLSAERWVNSSLALMGHSYNGDDTRKPTPGNWH